MRTARDSQPGFLSTPMLASPGPAVGNSVGISVELGKRQAGGCYGWANDRMETPTGSIGKFVIDEQKKKKKEGFLKIA